MAVLRKTLGSMRAGLNAVSTVAVLALGFLALFSVAAPKISNHSSDAGTAYADVPSCEGSCGGGDSGCSSCGDCCGSDSGGCSGGGCSDGGDSGCGCDGGG